MTIDKLLILSCVVTCSVLQVSYGAPYTCSPSSDLIATNNAKNYLTQYGYLGKPVYTPGRPDTRDFTGALHKFQKFSGLPPTGVVDEATKAQMDKPRCGFPDAGDVGTSTDKWANSITYRIDVYTPDLSIQLVQEEISRAWQVWANVTPLTITEVGADQEADIVVSFQEGDHNDGYPFDGPGGVLGHGFFPPLGHCHFDEAETWTVGSTSGTNLFVVAVHEFGHSLGLKHSDVSGSIMLPTYPEYQDSNLELSSDDILQIQTIYGGLPSGGHGLGSSGSASSSSSHGSRDSALGNSDGNHPAKPPRTACSGEFNTVFKTTDGTLYGLIDTHVWNLTNRLTNGQSVLSGTTSLFNSRLNSQPRPQAAVTIDDITYIFKDCTVWRFHNTRFETTGSIGDYWPGLPCNIDAAFKADDGYTYFFLDQDVYQYLGSRFQSSGPISSLEWSHFPTDLTRIDAISPSGNFLNDVYIFSGNKYWKMNQSSKMIYPGYPKDTVFNWLSNCTPVNAYRM